MNRTSRLILLALIAQIALLFSPALAHRGQTVPQKPSEAGAYDIYFNSVKKGLSQYRFDAQGNLALTGTTGLGAESKGVFTFEANRPSKVAFEVTGVGAAKVSYEIEGEAFVRRSNEEETKAKMPAGGTFYYTLHPILLKSLLDQYNVAQKGSQVLPAIDLIKGQPRTVAAELSRTELRHIMGRPMPVRLWRLDTPPNREGLVYTDESNRPLYWWVPGMQFEMVHQGYEALRPSFRYANAVSPPAYQVKIEKNVWMAMRDGVRLMADVYRPDAEGWFPVLFQRTCYDRSEFGEADGEFYAQRGYVYVTQHVRGRGGSEGPFEPFVHEAADGYDSLQWCGTQPWSNGKVGMLGASYNGFCLWMAAKTRPKWLKTTISVVTMAGPPDGAPWDGGSFFFGNMLAWYGLLRDKEKTQPFAADMTAAQNTLPISEADKVLFGKTIDSYRFWIDRTRLDDAVKRGAYRFDIDKVDLPVLHISSWHDSTAIGTKRNYLQMIAHGRRHQKLIWGPWDHFTNRESQVGKLDFGPDAYIDLRTLYLRWFDRWLKDRQNGIDREPPVDTFLVGENRWHHGSAWPDKRVAYQRWFLHAANPSGRGSQLLSPKAPGQGAPTHYTYDPAAYRYSPQFAVNFFFNRLSADDTRMLCARKDQLVYDSPPLERPLTLCGPVKGTLYAATSAVDTDWVVSLLDVYPDGKAIGLCGGFVRARFRQSYARPTLLRPDKVYAYDVDMWQTGVVVPRGHRLRVVVSSTLFPDQDRNLNTGEPASIAKRSVVAKQTIYQDASHPSHIVLPVLPFSAQAQRS